MMNSASSTPTVKRLVLLGGGHSHLTVLKSLAMRPVPGLELILITRDIHTPYSGALPGYISGVYQFDDMHIDLRPLAQFAGARLIHEEISQIDLQEKLVLCANRPPISFDILSLNTGSRPNAAAIPGAEKFAIGVKPMDSFLKAWDGMLETAVAQINAGKVYTMAIVGGGPASVELAFSSQYRILKEVSKKKYTDASKLHVLIISADEQLLKFHNRKVIAFTHAELERRGIKVLTGHRVTEFRKDAVHCDQLAPVFANTVIYATGASIPQWPKECGLQASRDGFVQVNNFLQSTSHPFVFACGDVASIAGSPRPKSGVYAVRHGKPLLENLLRYATGKPLRSFVPQKHALALMYTGDRKAIASRQGLFFHGSWVWYWKDRIDMAFIRKYSEFPEVKTENRLTAGLTDQQTERELSLHALRCTGCAAKVGGSILGEVLQELAVYRQDDVVSTGSNIEDAALIEVSNHRLLVQSVDYLRAFINDPWLFARIATNHCLSDIYAMGAEPHSALAFASVPFASKRFMQESLAELMHGCTDVLLQHRTALIGGHSSEGPELGFGLSVNGFAHRDAIIGKSGVQTGDVLILCKPLGTGTLLAADMRRKARGRWIEAALLQMLVSNREAAHCFRNAGAHACTDITGFGLAGHLLEMIKPNNAEIELRLESLPQLDGALECLQAGIQSSLHRDNQLNETLILNANTFQNTALYELLFDPQTSGGLLGSIPAAEADRCLEELHAGGYPDARQVGHVISTVAPQPSVVLK
jgi:selenide, water dikinase